MTFKLTYSDGQESQYGDDTVWALDDGVLKLGKKDGEWSVLLSPSHWAVIEVGASAKDDGEKDRSDDEDSDDEDGKKSAAKAEESKESKEKDSDDD